MKRDFDHTISVAVLDYAGPDGPGTLETRALEAIAELAAQLTKSERAWVISGRLSSPPVSWAALAAPLGISKQALQKKYQAVIEQALSDEVKGCKHWWRYDNGCCAACRRPMAHPSTTHPELQPYRMRQHQLTTGELVKVCGSCKTDPVKLYGIETDPLV